MITMSKNGVFRKIMIDLILLLLNRLGLNGFIKLRIKWEVWRRIKLLKC